MRIGLKGLLGALGGVALFACASIAGISDPSPEQRQFGTGQETTESGVTVSPKVIPIPNQTCQAGVALEQDIRLANDTDKTVPFVVEAPAGSPYQLRRADEAPSRRLTGELEPRERFVFKLLLSADRPGDSRADISVTTGEDEPVLINVSSSIIGSTIVYGEPFVDFGDVRKDGPIPDFNLPVENTGNADVVILEWIGATEDFSLIAEPLPLVLKPNTKATVRARFATGAENEAPIRATFTPNVKDYACGGPTQIELRGRRINFDVTATPGSIAFNPTTCNSGGGLTGAVELTNFAPVEAQIVSATLRGGAGSPFNTSNVPATIPGNGGKANVTVTTKPPGATVGGRDDVLDIRVDASGKEQTFSINLSQQVNGAILTLTAPSSPSLTLSNNGLASFTIRNDGTSDILLRHPLSGPDTGAFNVFDPGPDINDFVVFANSSNTVNVRMSVPASDAGAETFHAAITTEHNVLGGPWCNAGSVPVINLTGNRP